MGEPSSQAANRRNSHRRAPRQGVRVACHADAAGEGPDLAVSILDASQTGLRLLTRQPLAQGQEVLLRLHGQEGVPPLVRQGIVMWAVPMADGTCGVGVQFHKRILYRELLALTQIV